MPDNMPQQRDKCCLQKSETLDPLVGPKVKSAALVTTTQDHLLSQTLTWRVVEAELFALLLLSQKALPALVLLVGAQKVLVAAAVAAWMVPPARLLLPVADMHSVPARDLLKLAAALLLVPSACEAVSRHFALLLDATDEC